MNRTSPSPASLGTSVLGIIGDSWGQACEAVHNSGKFLVSSDIGSAPGVRVSPGRTPEIFKTAEFYGPASGIDGWFVAASRGRAMARAALSWRVEAVCQSAWPALRQVRLDGWLLRFSGGKLSRRANSANPLGAEPASGSELIAACEALYRRQRQPAIFRLPSMIAPQADKALVAAGYTSEGETCVLHGDIAAVAAADPEVRLARRASPQWLAAMAGLQHHTPEQSRSYRRILGSLMVPAAFASVAADGEIVALAYGVVHDRLLCCESVVTDPRRQRRGYARRVVRSLAAWGQKQGAAGVCLEVVADNHPALALYEGIGIDAELYRYHYRRQPPPSLG